MNEERNGSKFLAAITIHIVVDLERRGRDQRGNHLDATG